MVTSRVALGSVSTLAAAALLLGAAPFVFNHAWKTVASTPWGAISSFSGNLSSSTPSDGDRSQLLRLAALKGSKVEAGQTDAAMTAAAELSAALPVTQPMQASETNPPPASVAQASPASGVLTGMDAAPSPAPAADDGSSQMASAEPAADETGDVDAVPLPPASPTRGIGMLININTASPDALDRFPGAGHIGHAIVSHRPYHAIGDLVRKRVLRTSDFQKIQSRISVD